MSETIYILELKNNKYYIGKSNNVEKRFKDHMNGTGSTWTKLHKPIKILKEIPNCNNFDEDKYTKEYMSKYGINNVRGGTYTQIKLDNNTIKLLEKEMRGSNNSCFKCGSKSHFAKDCNANANYESESEEEVYVWCCEYCNEEFEDENKCIKHENICNKKKSPKSCFKCGRNSHFANNCYAKTNIHNKKIISDSDSDEDYY